VSSNVALIVHIIKKDRLSTCFPRSFIRVAAAVQPGIAVPPLPTLRPGTFRGPCKSGLSVKQVNECRKVLSTVPALVAPIVRPGAIPPGPKLKKWGCRK